MNSQSGLSMILLRAWMWSVPLVMLGAAMLFGVLAAMDERWGLLGIMVVIGLFALGLLLLHYWVLYRLGKAPER